MERGSGRDKDREGEEGNKNDKKSNETTVRSQVGGLCCPRFLDVENTRTQKLSSHIYRAKMRITEMFP